MGGKALKHLNVRRFNRDEYRYLVDKTLSKFGNLFPLSTYREIFYYRNKETFGDCDVVVLSSELPENWRDTFSAAVASKGLLRNGDVTSIEVDGLQFDFINAPATEFDIACDYFAYNDLGNLMGRVAHRMGFKYGHDGLKKILRGEGSLETQVVASMNVSRLSEDIFSFLGYDYERFKKGFDTLEEVFGFAASSFAFHPDIYLLHNRNATSRIRDAKRASYTEFLAWCDKQSFKFAPYSWASVSKFAYHEAALQSAFQKWPEFRTEYAKSYEQYEHARKLHSIFNGNVVREWTNIEGPMLGILMRQIREHPNFKRAASDLDAPILKLITLGLAVNFSLNNLQGKQNDNQQ